MNCLSRLSSYTASIFGRTSHFIATTATNSHQSWIPFWRRSCVHPGLHLEFLSTRFRVQCYSSRKPSLKASVKKKKDPQPTTVMDHENDAFFVVRKGDVVGVYKNFADCQAQVGSSVINLLNCHPMLYFFTFAFLFIFLFIKWRNCNALLL